MKVLQLSSLLLLPLLLVVVESSLPSLIRIAESALPKHGKSDLAKHNIVKRKVNPGELYVYANRKGCVSVTKSSSTCPVSWKLSAFFAKNYELSVTYIQDFVDILYEDRIPYSCINSLRKTLCSQLTPKCFEDGSKDFGNARQTCETIYTNCPKALANAYKKEEFCSDRFIWTGVHSLGKCTGPTDYVTGVCSQPKYKMTPYFFKDYRTTSNSIVTAVNDMERSKLYSSTCLTKYKDIVCNAVYCSEDEKQLLTEFDLEDCLDVISHCFEGKMDKKSLATLNTTCHAFPKKSLAERVTAPPTVGRSSNTSTASCQKSTLMLAVTPFILAVKVMFM